MRSGYWLKLYNRADSQIYKTAQRQIREQTGRDNRKSSLKGKPKDPATRDAVLEKSKWNREFRVTWALALEFLVRDLVQTAEFDFPFSTSRKADEEKNLAKARALRSTREGYASLPLFVLDSIQHTNILPSFSLPQAFFDFVESMGGEQVRPRIHVNPKALDPRDSQWHGKGDWVTTMKLN